MGRVQSVKSTLKASATREKTSGADLSQDQRLHLLSGHRSDKLPYVVRMLDSLAIFFFFSKHFIGSIGIQAKEKITNNSPARISSHVV